MTQEQATPTASAPDTQRQRWLKYGANVALVTLVVIALAVALVYVAERKPKRVDTTAAGYYSLKPQTLNIIKDNRQPITIIGFYTKAKPGDATADATPAGSDGITAAPVDKLGVVTDLLDEYRTRGSNIQTEMIDPVENPERANARIKEISEKYCGDIAKYRDFTTTVPVKYQSISKLTSAEYDQLIAAVKDNEVTIPVALLVRSIGRIAGNMKKAQDDFDVSLREVLPDYPGVAGGVADKMQTLSGQLGQIIQQFTEYKDNNEVPASLRAYMSQSLPRYTEIKKQADALAAAADTKTLGQLDLETIRKALKQNTILILGSRVNVNVVADQELRTLPGVTADVSKRIITNRPYSAIADLSRAGLSADQIKTLTPLISLSEPFKVLPLTSVWKNSTARPSFAGEQLITTEIVALNQPAKPKVCFVRNGGRAISDAAGPLSSMAQRLRDYNFEVMEKDLSGMSAQMAAMQQQEPAPEPSDDDIKDAVWVVYDQTPPQNPMTGAPMDSIERKIADHLTNGKHWVNGEKADGGSVLVLVTPHSDSMAETMGAYGLNIRTDTVATHALIKSENTNTDEDDFENIVDKRPNIFSITHWGDHPITNPLDTLSGVLVLPTPVQSKTDAGTSVLVVDPMRAQMKGLMDGLKDAKFTVYGGTTPQEAMSNASGHAIDVILMTDNLGADVVSQMQAQVKGAPGFGRAAQIILARDNDTVFHAKAATQPSLQVVAANVTNFAVIKPAIDDARKKNGMKASVTMLLPIPTAPNSPLSWGETDSASMDDDAGPKYHSGDVDGPLFAGAAVEASTLPPADAAAKPQDAGTRLVILGSGYSVFGAADDPKHGVVDIPDKQLEKKGIANVPLFPGNGEFFMNSVFWLNHQESMIAISPTAMNISRISAMSDTALKFWRVGVLLIGLPGLVLLAGAGVFYSRRD